VHASSASAATAHPRRPAPTSVSGHLCTARRTLGKKAPNPPSSMLALVTPHTRPTSSTIRRSLVRRSRRLWTGQWPSLPRFWAPSRADLTLLCRWSRSSTARCSDHEAPATTDCRPAVQHQISRCLVAAPTSGVVNSAAVLRHPLRAASGSRGSF